MKSVKTLGAIASIFLAIAPLPLQAQIIPDNTLGIENSRVNLTPSVDGTVYYRIDRGATRGPNLFHSFSNFDLQSGEAAYFAPAAGVERIFARVTSQFPSQLDGILGVQGSQADLFLLNPQGIVFGPNARLDLGGSFIGSSAQAVQFQDGSFFSAVQPETFAPLTVSVPLGLQLGQQAGAIQVQGTGHRLRATDPYLAPYIPDAPYAGLQVAPQRTLALLGGDLGLVGGVIQAPAGRVELGSVAQSGWVQLQSDFQGWSLAYPDLTQFGSLSLSDQASIEVGGGPLPGNLQLQAGNIRLQDASIIRNLNVSSEGSGKIAINATQSLTLSGLNSQIKIPTVILQDHLGFGQAENFQIRAPQIAIEAGAAIGNRNYGLRGGGELHLEVEDKLRIEGFATQQPDAFSRIATITLSSGHGGAMRVNAQNIDVNSGGFLGSATLLEGTQGGDVWVNSDRITVQGISPAGVQSVLGANHLGNSGYSGDLHINTRILETMDRGLVGTTSVSSGNAGNLTIHAKESITLRDTGGIQDIYGGINSSVTPPTPILQELFGLPAMPSGTGGNIFVQTPYLSVENGAQITVQNSGIGRAGILKINAQQIQLKNQGSLDALTLNGNGGNIQIQSQQLLLLNESGIYAIALGDNNIGDGGNIKIDSEIILGMNNSDILARAQQGRGGNIDITAEAILGLESRPQLTSNNDINASSNLGVDGTIRLNLLTENPITNSTHREIKPMDSSELIGVGCEQLDKDQFTISGKGGLPTTPTSWLNSPGFWTDQRLPLFSNSALSNRNPSNANPSNANPSNAHQPSPNPLMSPKIQHSQSFDLQEAVTWKRLPRGEVQLLSPHASSLHPTQTRGCLLNNT